MRTAITFRDLIARLQNYVDGEESFESLRSFVYSRYDGEDEIEVDETADDLLSVLSPYIETETALPDPNRDIRLRRLAKVLASTTDCPVRSAAVFALKFDELVNLEKKRVSGVIPDSVFRSQISKLSPATYDTELLCNWVSRHTNEPELDPEKMKS